MNPAFLALTSAVEAVGPARPGDPIPPQPAQPARAPAPIDRAFAASQGYDRVEVGGASGPAITQSYAKFDIHPGSGALSIKIIDARTEEVIRQIPSEEVMRIAEELQALARRSGPSRSNGSDGRTLPGAASASASGSVDRYA